MNLFNLNVLNIPYYIWDHLRYWFRFLSFVQRANDKGSFSWIDSKAHFHGYTVWVLPKTGSECDRVCRDLIERFSMRFPPLRLPVWQPHMSIVAGITDEKAAMNVVRNLVMDQAPFVVEFRKGAEVDGEALEDRRTVYFSWQKLRAAWMHASAGKVVNEHGEDALEALCRRARELLGEKTVTEKFTPHLSLVYFNSDEIVTERHVLKGELTDAFPEDTQMVVDELVVAKTDGVPGDWIILHRFPLKGVA
eukprot:538886_1